ncbi:MULTISPECIES: lytic transglycosylase domain-containing protein [Amycolatopsis]|uniref:lytic transglycosylase domain-containing protein n=1 Tax=Amycolatopsis TaxID=1813 RepID=UPI000566A223|nr:MULTISPECIES: lytic murein transglycosylase [Amycolatopsis]MCG3751482.1 lytic murein transglycosylase [Amycolatopsis sp. Poz14]
MARRRPQGRNARSRAFAALAGGALVVLPTVTSSGIPVALRAAEPPSAAQAAPSVPGLPPGITLPPIGVDGSLPQPPVPQALGVPGYPNGPGSATTAGPLGIPDSMLRAYRNAADIMAREQPGCHVDWALIAAIGRVESNHARGGYVDARGNTLERILGPVLDGSGGFAAIRDTDHGRFDGDPVWDRAVGATQFIPSTWASYASDGNGDGVSDPNNIYDETLATARYLCSGGLDLSSDAAQRLAVRRYNNSQSYVDTVMAYAYGYRNGVSKLPDSQVPIGAPPGPGAVEAAAGSPAGDVAPPAPPPVTPAPPSQQPGTPTQLPGSSTAPSSSSSPAKPTSSAPTTSSTPTSSTSPTSTTPTTSTTTSSSAPANPATSSTTTSSTTTEAAPTH